MTELIVVLAAAEIIIRQNLQTAWFRPAVFLFPRIIECD
jgi:hypothetical protein